MSTETHPHQTEVELSVNEERFALNVARGMPLYLAAASAGYSPSNGGYLARRKHVSFALREMANNLADVIRTFLPGDRR